MEKEMEPSTGVLLKIVGALPKILKHLVFPIVALWNVATRPRLSMEFGQKDFCFTKPDGTQHHPFLFCLILKNQTEKDLHINPSKFWIERESLAVLLQGNLLYSKCNSGTRTDVRYTTNDYVINFFHENWRKISGNVSDNLILKPHSTLVIPLYPRDSQSHAFFNRYDKSKLFCAKRKITVRLTINSKEYHYGATREDCLHHIVNWLAFWQPYL